jgi:CDP-4-dehydro-6-deoxyglucose reductase
LKDGFLVTTQTPPVAPAAKTRKVLRFRVAEIRDYNSQIRELILRCEDPETFAFRAGQFVMLHVPAQPKALLRAYSIASREQDQTGFRLIFKYVENGPGSEFVWKLKAGVVLDFTGPFGRVFFKEPPTQQAIFLNTGSGISQHFSFIESNIDKYPDLRYRLLFGVRTESDIYYVDELERLKKQLKDFEYGFVLSRASAAWTGRVGYVQNHIQDFEHLSRPTTFYLCGNGAMIKDVKAQLAAESFDPALILSEAFD